MHLLFDIGGTKTRFALSNDLTSFDDPVIIDTPKNFSEAVLEYNEILRKMLIGIEVDNFVGGIAGVMDSDGKKLIRSSPKLPDWEGKLIGYELERIVKVEPRIFNDADMATLGESVFGAGRDDYIVAYLTISTGVGGGLVIDNKLQPTTYGFEPGYVIFDPKTGDNIQDLISGTALTKKFNVPAKDVRDQKVYDEITKRLGIFLVNLTYMWSPDVIVLGGGITNDLDMEEVEEAMKENMVQFPEIPKVKRAELGSLNGIWGALAQCRNLQ
jgi:glucokinase